MRQSVIAVVGISGVGKSTMLRTAVASIPFQHLQASALIKEAKELQSSGTVATDDLRTKDITDNQALLIKGFSNRRDPVAALIVIDGHTIIDAPSGLIIIEPSVFAAMGVTEFIFIADDPMAILSRRANDKSRNRPERSTIELAHHQEQAVLAAFSAALNLAVPLHIFTSGQIEALREIIAQAAEAPKWAD